MKDLADLKRKAAAQPDLCDTYFRTRDMRRAVLCCLRKGHASRHHEHDFGNWIARVWPRHGKPMRFRYSAKPGKSLPASVCR